MTERVITIIKQNDDGTISKSNRVGKPAEEHINNLPIQIEGKHVITEEILRKLKEN